jgi:hypothetical protein
MRRTVTAQRCQGGQMPLGQEFENAGAELIEVDGHPPSMPVINNRAVQSG